MWWVFPIFAFLVWACWLPPSSCWCGRRGQLARKVVQNTTVATGKGVTQRGWVVEERCCRGQARCPSGPRAGTEFRLTSNAVRVGRDLRSTISP